MAFEEWMNDSGWEPSEAGEAALEDAWQAAHAEGVAEGATAEREQWVAECKRREAHYQTLQKHDGVQPKLLPAMTLRLLRETMEDESDDDPR